MGELAVGLQKYDIAIVTSQEATFIPYIHVVHAAPTCTYVLYGIVQSMYALLRYIDG